MKRSNLRGSGKTASPWMKDNGGVFESKPLSESVEADVCVVGAGVAGLTSAYLLARAGRSVVVLEAGQIGAGETSRSTAHLSTILGERYGRLEEIHGEPACRLVAESRVAAIAFVEALAAGEGIGCGFRRMNGYLIWPDGAPVAEPEEEQAACDRAGLESRLVQRAPAEGWNTGPCLELSGQAVIDPLRYLSGLARAAARQGARIFTRSHAKLLPGDDLRLKARSGLVTAKTVIFATNAPVQDSVSFSMRQSAWRSYAIAAPYPDRDPALYWDTLDCYHYVRVEGGRVIVGGEDHKVAHAADPAERWERLEAWMRVRFPDAGPVSHRWSGQVQESSDGLPFIGPPPQEARDILVVTGDSGDGITGGTIGAMILADRVLGRKNEWAEVYDSRRLRMGSALSLAKENLDAAAQYLRYAAPGDIASVEEIPPGSGAVIMRNGAPVAVHRAADGTLTERSAVCPHLGGRVCWNPGEGSWDCPVHGSRFAPDGKVVSGPAAEGLAPPLDPLTRIPIVGRWLGSQGSPPV